MYIFFKPLCGFLAWGLNNYNLCNRRNKNIAAVALANKNARIAWALLSKKTDFLPEGEPA
jgi:hypothetical protein